MADRDKVNLGVLWQPLARIGSKRRTEYTIGHYLRELALTQPLLS
jgi:hypothetical protein